MRIRPMTDEQSDYEAVASIWCANWPEYPKTAEQYRYNAEKRDPRQVLGRLVAEEGGVVIATGYYSQETDSDASGKYLLYVQVEPGEQGRGVGSALFEALLEDLGRHGPAILQSFTREDRPGAIGFLNRRGFEVTIREQNSELDLEKFDSARFTGVVERVRGSGIEIVSATELAGRDPDWTHRVWELNGEIVPDVPDDDTLVNEPFGEFEKLFAHPDYLADGYFVALDGDRYVGVTSVWRRQVKEGEFYTRLTGVLRSHRRRGIATALKVRAAEFAKSTGARTIVTDNEENNPMYDLNVELGFEPTHAWLQFRKELR
jgi:GNAT superfamily N-acetyltransferase